jgi:hypothetical protein
VKAVVVALLLALGSVSANADDLNLSYNGEVRNSLVLPNASSGAAILKEGPVSVGLNRLNLARNPLRYFRERVLTVRQGAQSFAFAVPVDSIQKDGSFSFSNGPLNLTSTLERRIVGQAQEERSLTCSYEGFCNVCRPHGDRQTHCGYQYSVSCSGVERVLMYVNIYDSISRLQIKTATGATEIQSVTTSHEPVLRLKTLAACH